MPSFYVAASLRDRIRAGALIGALEYRGWKCTLDWTKLDGLPMQQFAEKEVNGVLEADVLVFLAPGGRGAHVELGVALGAGKRVMLVGTAVDEIAFYDHSRVARARQMGTDLLADYISAYYLHPVKSRT